MTPRRTVCVADDSTKTYALFDGARVLGPHDCRGCGKPLGFNSSYTRAPGEATGGLWCDKCLEKVQVERDLRRALKED